MPYGAIFFKKNALLISKAKQPADLYDLRFLTCFKANMVFKQDLHIILMLSHEV